MWTASERLSLNSRVYPVYVTKSIKNSELFFVQKQFQLISVYFGKFFVGQHIM